MNEADSNSERVCPDCDGACYDDDGFPCMTCYAEGVIVPLTSLRERGRMVSE